MLDRVCVVTVPANCLGAGFGSVPVHSPGMCGEDAPGGDVPDSPGHSSADSSMPRGKPRPPEVVPFVHGGFPPTLLSPLSHRAPKVRDVAR